MKSEARPRRAKDYIDSLATSGRYAFTSHDAREALGVSPEAVKLALNRLIKQKLITSPARGFYIIIPPEYRSLGSLPADQFVPALMQNLGLPYYASLLTAAQYHGAAHHRPQEFQVMLGQPRRSIHSGRVAVVFNVRKRIAEVPTQPINTPRGTVVVSTPEATALDLVGYQETAGGLDQIATILSELSERIDPAKLVVAARTAPVSWSQRLGYLLELVDAAEQAAALKFYVWTAAKQTVPLLPGIKRSKDRRDADWKLQVNADVEAEV